MAKIVNTYKVSSRLVNSLHIHANGTSASIIQNDFLPDSAESCCHGLKLISIINGDAYEAPDKILQFLNETIWPTIILSRRTSMKMSLHYIQAGAIDFVSGSICSYLLLAKCINIFNLMDKSHSHDLIEDTRTVLSLDYKKRTIRTNDGAHVKLTASETTLLGLLAEHRSECLSRDELLSRNITGNDATYRSLNVLISRLRMKLETITKNTVIASVRGYGYSLGAGVELSNVRALDRR